MIVSKKNIIINNDKENISSLMSQKKLSSTLIKKSSKTIRDYGLSDSEKKIYGDRCPTGYEKINLLGRGGWALVWLARNIITDEKVALKQFVK